MAFKIEKIENFKTEKHNVPIKNILEREITLFGNSFNNNKKESFYTELSVLLNAGISLKDSLSLIWEEQKQAKNKSLLGNIIENVVAGKSFSEAIKLQKVFTEYEYYSLKIGEETGTLKKVSNELALFFRRRNEQRKNILNALSYPIVVLTTALLSVAFMLKYIVPMFAGIFKQNKVELPALTKVVISASNGLQKYFWFIILAFMLLLFFKKIIQNKESYKRITSGILLKIPFIGELFRKMYLAQFTQAVALLTAAKVPVLNSLQLTKKMINFYPLQKAIDKIEKSVLQGKNLSTSLKPHKIFDNKMISLIKVAEETNQNEYIFERLTTQYNDEIQYKSKMLSTILEPIIIIVLGGIVAIILIAMYLPMFKLSTVMG